MKSIEEEAVELLKEKKSYHRVLKEILIKYKKIGRLSGSVYFENLSEEESLLLAPLDYKFYSEKKGKLNIKKFVEYFKKGKFKAVDFQEVLRLYFNDDMYTNKQVREIEKNTKKEYFEDIFKELHSTKVYEWLRYALEQKRYGYNSIIKRYEEDKKSLRNLLFYINEAVSVISFDKDSVIPLALLSSKVTRNSHYFDINTGEGNLLTHCICYIIGEKYPRRAEEVNEILYRAGIVRDEISNNTITFGLRAYIKGKEHKGINYFYTNKQPITLSIKNLSNIESLISKNNKVFVFENPTVFSQVMENTLDITPTLICTSGQINISSLMLLDKLSCKGCKIYYSGDFDPEGLQIADKLKIRYKDNLILWRFSVQDYLKIKGQVSIDSRINKLSNIQSQQLIPLKNKIIEIGTAGYQELLINKYIQDIKNLGSFYSSK